MAPFNYTGTSHSVFILLGIPGLEEQHLWISLPFFISYLVALFGNITLILVIIAERSLHEPMYLFLCMLAAADLILSTTTVPKALAIFWFRAGAISLDGCVTQIFFIHATFIAESGILLAMAFDRYVAICDPLHYSTVLSHVIIVRIGLAVVLRSFCVILPDVFLVKRLPFCRSNVLPHTYCEHMAVARFACADIRVNVWYGLSVLLSTVVLDALLILVSYGLILHTVFRLPSRGARQKALGTCGSHLGVISMFYLPGIFTIITQRFGQHVPLHTHILLANVCMLAPPMLNPIIYGIKTRQIRERVLSSLSSQWKLR
ncbi:olfactory receptor 549 [Mus musculus]|uniref:Olfactory receptor n=2 Tax=Mus musculus TaxID=10090 RepID=Q8VH03_MOUSE|nr:olfactory receptor MOR31-3 [Mus musculus]AAP71041.1 olfactory receptor Olfr549 [Mus musculus]EDL16608.1 olfactory receptor 549 [Mus musculus]